MTYLEQLNEILPDLLLRMEQEEKNKIFDCFCSVYLTDEEFDIIHNTDILQFFDYRLELMSQRYKEIKRIIWNNK